jgi:8-oxo-dGTP diphosphatase
MRTMPSSIDPSRPVEIALAVVRRADQVLIGPRPQGTFLAGLWEFPGGKVQPQESPEEAAVRECREETGMEIELRGQLATVENEYAHGRVRLEFFAAEPLDPSQRPAAPFRWVPIADLARFRFPPANRAVLKSLI